MTRKRCGQQGPESAAIDCVKHLTRAINDVGHANPGRDARACGQQGPAAAAIGLNVLREYQFSGVHIIFTFSPPFFSIAENNVGGSLCDTKRSVIVICGIGRRLLAVHTWT